MAGQSLAAIEEADIILFVIDLGQGVTAQDRDIYATIGNKRHILVQNKVDLKKVGVLIGTKDVSRAINLKGLAEN